MRADRCVTTENHDVDAPSGRRSRHRTLATGGAKSRLKPLARMPRKRFGTVKPLARIPRKRFGTIKPLAPHLPSRREPLAPFRARFMAPGRGQSPAAALPETTPGAVCRRNGCPSQAARPRSTPRGLSSDTQRPRRSSPCRPSLRSTRTSCTGGASLRHAEVRRGGRERRCVRAPSLHPGFVPSKAAFEQVVVSGPASAQSHTPMASTPVASPSHANARHRAFEDASHVTTHGPASARPPSGSVAGGASTGVRTVASTPNR